MREAGSNNDKKRPENQRLKLLVICHYRGNAIILSSRRYDGAMEHETSWRGPAAMQLGCIWICQKQL